MVGLAYLLRHIAPMYLMCSVTDISVVYHVKDTFSDKTAVFFQKLASASDVTVVDSYNDDTAVQLVTDCAKLYIPLGDLAS